MKPLKVEMQAFESYYDKTVIDFEKLNREKVFLVLGKTGCGKTTIFDAICYALYGESSGSQREGEDAGLKNKDADFRKECYVELLFENNGKKYKVRRVPIQTVPSEKNKSKSKELKYEKSTLEFLDEDKPTVTGKETVKAIEGLIGLTKQQFNQVCMLAQGDFSKILMSNTIERMKILRKIFGTENYQAFADKIKKKYNECANKSEVIKDRLDETFNQTVYLTEEENEKKNAETSHDYRIQYMEKGLENCQTALDQNQIEKDAVSKAIIDLNTKLNEAKEYQSNLKAKEAEENNILDYKSKGEQYDAIIKQYESQKTEQDKMQEKATALTLLLPRYKELSILNQDLLCAEQKKIKNESDKKKLETQISNGKAKLESIVENLKAIAIEIENETDCNVALENQKQSYDAIQNAKTILGELEYTQGEFNKHYKNLQDAQEKYETAEHEALEKERGYFASMAGNLAKNQLEENKPCPVCGSLNHPNPASLSGSDVTKDQYEESKKKEKSARENKETAIKTFESSNAKREAEKKQLIITLADLCLPYKDNSDIDAFLDTTNNLLSRAEEEKRKIIDDLQKEIKHYKKLHENKEELTSNQEELSNDLQKWNESLNAIEVSIASLTTAVKEKTEQVEKLKSSLEYEDEETANLEIKKLNDALAKAEKDKKEALNKQQENQNLLSSSLGKLDALNQRIKAYSGKDENSILAELLIAKEKESEVEDKTKYIVTTQSNLNKSLSVYKLKRNQNEELLKEFNMLSKFNRFFNAFALKNMEAGNGGKRWISLETYVLSYYLDRVLERASLRLKRMTNGNYSLVRRKDDVVVGKGQGGLDIDVRDNSSGTIRHAASLSGGETFMASLALALGLSDYVKEATGKSKIEVLYVDEGFGTLDKETLDNVVSVLIDLAQQESTTIGLISHVENLKMYFPRGIEVKKDSSGHSSLEIV